MKRKFVCSTLSFGFLGIGSLLTLHAQTADTIRGVVLDPLGRAVANSTISLYEQDGQIREGSSAADGSFQLTVPHAGRYHLHVVAAGFAEAMTATLYVANGQSAQATVHLKVGTLSEQVVVTATGTALPQSQTGASVDVIDREKIQALNKFDVLEELRLVPGAQVLQSGQRGGATSLFLRGGESNYNKVLIDNIPANTIGGGFDFAQLTNSGVERVEVLRGANSVLYGADALAGVVSVTSARGRTAAPFLHYAADGGNFKTYSQDASLSQAIGRFDYAGNFARYDTRGSYPNSAFHNVSFNGNGGWFLNERTGIRVTARHNSANLGSPNSISFFQIPDDSTQRNNNTYIGANAQDQTTERWHNQVQFSYAQFSSVFTNASPTGIPYQSLFLGTVYLGKVVTLKGANGYSVTGQAILDFDGLYPQRFTSYEGHRSVNVQTEYNIAHDWTAVGGMRFEHENGQGLKRDNYDYFGEVHGSISHRLFATAGFGIDKNAVYRVAASPRVSLAYYLRSPLDNGMFGQTKLRFNFGQGIEEPSTSQQSSALYSLLTPAQIQQFNTAPIGPQRSRTLDAGIEQGIAHGRVLLGGTFFYNRFYDLISFLGVNDLIAIGVPAGAAQATPFGGAYVNADSERALGAELTAKVDLRHGLLFEGQYTYLDPVVTKAFGAPSFNPNIPNVPIGAFAPLVGARPFRRAPHSGSLTLLYNRKQFTGAFTGSLIGKRDDSTFLSDPEGGNGMLLPNRNLAAAYQKFDLSGTYAMNARVQVYTSMENLFSQRYEAAFGSPALPFTVRGGIRLSLGGPSGWRLKQ